MSDNVASQHRERSFDSLLNKPRKMGIAGFAWAAAAVLLLLALYAAYETFAAHPLTMDSLHRDGRRYFFLSSCTLRRLAFFSAAMAAAAAFCWKGLRKDWPILLVPAVMLVLAGHVGALIAVLVQWTAGLAVGIPIYRRLRGDGQHACTGKIGPICSGLTSDPAATSRFAVPFGLTDFILAWFLGGAVNAYLAWIAFHWKVNYDYAYWCVLLLEIALWRRPLAEVVVGTARRADATRWRPGQWIIALSAMMLLPCAMSPWHGYDEQVRHLFFPKQVAMFGRHAFDPGFIWAMDTEVFAQAHYTIAYLLGGQYAARLSSFIMNFAAFLLLEDYARRRLGAVAAVGTALVAVSTPILNGCVSFVNLESPTLLVAAAATVVGLEMLRRPRGGTLLLFVFAAGFGYLYKQQTALVTVPLTAVLVIAMFIRAVQSASWRPILWLAAGGLTGAAIVSPFFIQNYVQTGNPIFPWLNGLFHSPWMDSNGNFQGIRLDNPLGPQSLFDLTFHGERFGENALFQFGVSYYVLVAFVPLIFLSRKRRLIPAVILGVFLVSVILWWKITSPHMRFFCGCMAPGSLLLGLTVQTLWELLRRSRTALVLATAAAAIVLAVNFASQFERFERVRPYPMVEMFTKQYKNSTGDIPRQEQWRRLFRVAAAKFGKDSRCLLFGSEPCLYMADQHIDWVNGGLTHPRYIALYQCRNGKETFDWIFREQKYDCAVMAEKTTYSVLNTREFRDNVEIVDSRGGLLLVAPKR